MSADKMPLGPVLMAVSKEMDLPRLSILAVERHIATTLKGGPAGSDLLRGLQDLDLAVQALDDLMACVATLSRGVPRGLLIDARPALDGLRLERVAASLRTKLGLPSAPLPPAPDLELF